MAPAFPKDIAPSAPPCIIDSHKNISTTRNRSYWHERGLIRRGWTTGGLSSVFTRHPSMSLPLSRSATADWSQRNTRNQMHRTIYSPYSPGRPHRTAQCWTRFIASHWETPPTPHSLYSRWNHRPGLHHGPFRTV